MLNPMIIIANLDKIDVNIVNKYDVVEVNAFINDK